MNRDLTTDINEIEHLLPTRKSGKSTELKMSGITTNWMPEDKFNYTTKELSKQEYKMVVARVVEIATRTLFENHMFKFAGQVYKQNSGGSIGDRWTGSASEMVMQDWANKYKNILVDSGLRVHLLAGYVDDGRQGTSVLPLGMKYNNDKKMFTHGEEQEQIDKNKQREGEATNQRMARICLEAMNLINNDL